jgi:hypothetical protein
LKYPLGRISRAISPSSSACSASGDNTPAAFRFPIAFSTFTHAADCVRIAPTITSNGVSPGHHPCAP